MSNSNPDTLGPYDIELDMLERLSNSVIDLIERGRFDDAERACLELKRRYPDEIDWIERTAVVHEARGELSQAIERYRQCIDFIDTHPDEFDGEVKIFYTEEIERLESRRER